MKDSKGVKTGDESSCKCPKNFKYRCSGDPSGYSEAGADGYSCMVSNCDPATDKNCYTSKYECDFGTGQGGDDTSRPGNCDDPSDVIMKTSLASYVNPLQVSSKKSSKKSSSSSSNNSAWLIYTIATVVGLVVVGVVISRYERHQKTKNWGE